MSDHFIKMLETRRHLSLDGGASHYDYEEGKTYRVDDAGVQVLRRWGTSAKNPGGRLSKPMPSTGLRRPRPAPEPTPEPEAAPAAEAADNHEEE